MKNEEKGGGKCAWPGRSVENERSEIGCLSSTDGLENSRLAVKSGLDKMAMMLEKSTKPRNREAGGIIGGKLNKQKKGDAISWN